MDAVVVGAASKLSRHDNFDKFLVIDVSVLVDFDALEQFIHLIIGQLVSQGGEHCVGEEREGDEQDRGVVW